MSNETPRCYNRKPYLDTVEVQDGWIEDGRRRMKIIADPMSKDCQQWGDLGEARLKQWQCGDCIWRPKTVLSLV